MQKMKNLSELSLRSPQSGATVPPSDLADDRVHLVRVPEAAHHEPESTVVRRLPQLIPEEYCIPDSAPQIYRNLSQHGRVSLLGRLAQIERLVPAPVSLVLQEARLGGLGDLQGYCSLKCYPILRVR